MHEFKKISHMAGSEWTIAYRFGQFIGQFNEKYRKNSINNNKRGKCKFHLPSFVYKLSTTNFSGAYFNAKYDYFISLPSKFLYSGLFWGSPTLS